MNFFHFVEQKYNAYMKISVFSIPKITYHSICKINTLYSKPTYKLIFFQNIIFKQQFCKFLTFNIEFFKNYNFSKLLLVISLFIKLKNFFHKNCNEISIKNYLNIFYRP